MYVFGLGSCKYSLVPVMGLGSIALPLPLGARRGPWLAAVVVLAPSPPAATRLDRRRAVLSLSMAADLQGGAAGGAAPRRGPNRELGSLLGLLGHSLSFLFAPGRFWVTSIIYSL
jgi:hypothetical protein